MQIYLLSDLKGHGKAGDIVNLNDGYAKNFVIKNKIGRVADNSVLSEIQSKKESDQFKYKTEIEEIKVLIKKLQSATVRLKSKVGANQKLFGSITAAEISVELKNQDIDIDKRHIVFDEPIKATGTYKVNVKFNHNLSGSVTVIVEELDGK